MKFRHRPRSAAKIIKDDVSGLFKLKSDFSAYSNYKNTELKEDLKLREALKQIPISERQKLEAEKLQKELFMAFEKIDDKTESFVVHHNLSLNFSKKRPTFFMVRLPSKYNILFII